MSLAQVLSIYLNLNLLILLGFVVLRLFSYVLKKSKWTLSSAVELKLHYVAISVLLLLTLIQPLLPHNDLFSPAAKVWSASSLKNFGHDYSTAEKSGYLGWATPLGNSAIPADQVTWLGLLLTGFTLLIGAYFLTKDLRALLKIKRSSFVVRRLGQVSLLVSDEILVPFSYWLPGQTNIVLPSSLLQHRENYKISVVHELQHHRHGDTKWVYVIWGLRLLCVANPAVYFWNHWIMAIQEFACDETLVDRNKVESQAYARCLVEVAQSAVGQKWKPVCATGLTFLFERNILKRRIQKMLEKSSHQIGWRIYVPVGVLLASVMGATAYASKGLIQDRRVNMAQAQDMAARIVRSTNTGDGFPVVVNEAVLRQLNLYIGTPEGRIRMRNALQRMPAYQQVVSESLHRYGVPAEIAAIPLIESGYKNLAEAEAGTSGRSAGIWQFIPSTARVFGMTVDADTDERLNVPMETDAAIRYLEANRLVFNDWQLSVMA